MKIQNLKINLKKNISLCLAFGMTLFPSISNGFAQKSINTPLIIQDESDISFDQALAKSGASSQKNKLWKTWAYNNNSYMTTVGDGGCRSLSITNALSLAFGIDDEKEIANILSDIISLNYNCKEMNNYILSENKPRKYKFINHLIDSKDEKILSIGNNSNNFLSQIEEYQDSLNQDCSFFGIVAFNKNNYDSIIDAINKLYNINPDTNVIIYSISAGTRSVGSPFGSKSDSGHYVTLLINVREFVENNSVYLIDSLPKNLANETKYHATYNFAEGPKMGSLVKFTNAYEIKRIKDEVLKLTYKNGSIDKDALSILKLESSAGIIICKNNIKVKKNVYKLNDKVFYNYEDAKIYVKK